MWPLSRLTGEYHNRGIILSRWTFQQHQFYHFFSFSFAPMVFCRNPTTRHQGKLRQYNGSEQNIHALFEITQWFSCVTVIVKTAAVVNISIGNKLIVKIRNRKIFHKTAPPLTIMTTDGDNIILYNDVQKPFTFWILFTIALVQNKLTQYMNTLLLLCI